MTDEPETRLSDLAREVVENAAPDELELLPDVTAAWLAGDLTADGSGPREDPLARRRDRRRARRRSAGHRRLPGAGRRGHPRCSPRRPRAGWQKASGRFGRKPAPVDQIIPPGVIEQADLVRANILKSAADLGVPPERAELIAANAYAALLPPADRRPVTTRARPVTTRRTLLTLAGTAALLTACGDDGTARRPGPALSVATGGPPAADDLIARLATYPSEYRFTPADAVDWDDEPKRAKAFVAMRAEVVAFLNWCRANGHPDIAPALPSDLTGSEYLVDPLVGNSDLLDTEPLFNAKEPIGRLVPDNETVSSDVQGMQSAFALIMLKTMLSKADYARLVTESPLVKAAAGKNIINIFPFTTAKGEDDLRYLMLLPGIVVAFGADPKLRWLIANPGQAMSDENQKRLIDGGGTLFTDEGFRVVHIDSSRAANKPATVAASLYEALRAVRS